MTVSGSFLKDHRFFLIRFLISSIFDGASSRSCFSVSTQLQPPAVLTSHSGLSLNAGIRFASGPDGFCNTLRCLLYKLMGPLSTSSINSLTALPSTTFLTGKKYLPAISSESTFSVINEIRLLLPSFITRAG